MVFGYPTWYYYQQVRSTDTVQNIVYTFLWKANKLFSRCLAFLTFHLAKVLPFVVDLPSKLQELRGN
jgi:hypothetical protein